MEIKMKSVKKIVVTALAFCAIATTGIAAQAAPYGHGDCRYQPQMAGYYAGDRHARGMHEQGWGHARHHKQVYVTRRHVRQHNYRMHRAHPGFSATVKVSPNFKVRINNAR
jgi:hypothetical protein